MLGKLTQEGQEVFEMIHCMGTLYTDCNGEIKKFGELYNIEFTPLPPVIVKVNRMFVKKEHLKFADACLKDKNRREELREMVTDLEALKGMLETVELKVRKYLNRTKPGKGGSFGVY